MDGYEKRFSETNAFFEDRLAVGSKVLFGRIPAGRLHANSTAPNLFADFVAFAQVSAKMIESIAEKTHKYEAP